MPEKVTSNAHKKMPGPGFLRSLALGIQFRRNYIKPMESLVAEFGDAVAFHAGPSVCLLVHPNAVEHVLKRNHANYRKPPSLAELQPVMGMGLLTSDGEAWRKHRKLIAPEFQHKKVEALFPIMQRHLLALLQQWRQRTDAFDVCPDISQTTYAIAGECFFGAHVEDSATVIYKSIDVASEVAVKRMSMPITNLPISWPLPSHRRLRKAVKAMDEVVYGILAQREREGSETHDVLSRLLRAGDLNRTQIRDEVMTLLLAGHETTANALSWTLYLLGRYPEVQNQLREEVRGMVKDEIPSLSDVAHLPFTKMVVEESMRLYPPAATIGRQAIAEDEIGGYSLPQGTIVNLAQWITHRLPEFWDEPEEFQPERFAHAERQHPFAYYPFGGGPRECVGKNMAMIEAITLLAGIIRDYEFELVSENVRIRPLITIRPDPGVWMRVRRVRT